MYGSMKIICGCSIAFLLASWSFAAAGDLRAVEAVRAKDKGALQTALKQHADVNGSEPDGATALEWAAHWDDLNTADLLIHAGANVNAANTYGVTPLSLACSNGSAAMVGKLLAAGADPNLGLAQTGETPLMTCSLHGVVEAVKLLLAHGANPDVRETHRGHTALMWASASLQPDAVRALVERHADVHARAKSGFTALMFAATKGDIETVKVLLAAGADVNEATPKDGSALVLASAGGHQAVAEFLLDEGANPNVADGFGLTALHYAIQRGVSFLTGVQYLSDYRLRPSDLTDLVKALLAHGAKPNAQVTKGFPGDTRGTDPPVVRIAGATPFYLAAVAADPELMRILLAAGADPLIATNAGDTPLMGAAGESRPATRSDEEEGGRKALEAVQIVLEHGVDVNARNKKGETAMHYAGFIGASDIAQLLVNKGAAVDVKSQTGETAWTMASGMCYTANQCGRYSIHKDTADLLIKLGAVPTTLAVVK